MARKRAVQEPSSNDHWTRYLPFIIVVVITQCAAASGLVTILSMLTTLYRAHPGNEETVGWVVTSYILVSAVSGAIGGRLGDIYGTRIVTLCVLLIAGAGSVVSAIAPSLGILIAGTALQGVANTLMPLLIAMTREYLPRRLVPVLIGVIAATGTVIAGIFFFVAGFLVDNFSYQGGFFFKTALVVLSFILILAIVPRSDSFHRPSTSIDYLRGILFGPAVAGLLIALEEGRVWGWSDDRTMMLIAGSTVLLAYWAWHQWRADNPLIQLRLLMHGNLLKANLVMLFLGLGCVQIGQMLITTLQQPDLGAGTGFGMSATTSGLIMIPLTAIALVTSPLAGWIAVRHSAKAAALLGGILGFVACALLAESHANFGLLMLGGLLATVAHSVLTPSAFNLIVEGAPKEYVSGASGLGFTFFSLGYAIGSHIMFMWQRTDPVSGPNGATYPSAFGLSLAFGYAAVMTALLIAVVVSIAKARTHSEPEQVRDGKI
jgi:MFS family permease